MRVWIIGRNYPLPNNQMQGSFELEQAKMLAKQDELEVVYLVASLHPTKRIKKSGFQNWKEEGVSVFTYSKLFLPRVYPFYFGKLRNKIWKYFLERVEREIGLPDVIHLHYPVMMMLPDVLNEYKKKGVRIVVTEHWTKVLAQKLDHYELGQLKDYMTVVDKFICVGEPLKSAICEMTQTKEKLIVIPNVVNQVFEPDYSRHEGFKFISVGRLVKVKQFDKIVQAFAVAFKDKPDVTLTIVGGGEEKDNIIKVINEQKMEDRVILTGSLSRADTAHKVAESDCLVCYSTFETFGVPVIEGWACGLPTISTTTCAVVDKLDEHLGIEISPYKLEELESAMKYIYKHSKSYDKKYITIFSEKHFSENVIRQKLVEVYSEHMK